MPYLHDLSLHLFELRLFTDVALHENVTLETQLPLRVTSTSILFKQFDGTVFIPAEGNIHHRNEILLGIGDPWVMANGHITAAGFRLTARLGVTLPLGSIEPNPFALGDEGKPHQHIQFGTGTFNPLTGLEVSRAFGPVTLLANGQAVWMAYANTNGYRGGHRITATLRAALNLGPVRPLHHPTSSPQGALILGFDVLHEQPETWNGVVQQDGNLGRTDLLISGGVTWNVNARTAVTLLARIPFFHHFINGSEHEQLTYPVVLTLMISEALTPH
ncbi:MAG: hypothetical protein JNM17_05760 [Archangium sp.]|nr:hypothetical protein [Archangium sp.]